MLGLMFGNGMHAVLIVHCKLLLHKELVLLYQVTWRETEIQRKRKRIYPNLSVSVSNISVSVNVNHTGFRAVISAQALLFCSLLEFYLYMCFYVALTHWANEWMNEWTCGAGGVGGQSVSTTLRACSAPVSSSTSCSRAYRRCPLRRSRKLFNAYEPCTQTTNSDITRSHSELHDTASLVMVWLSGNALVSIDLVALRRAWLVLGWVTVCGRVNHLGM